MVVSKCERCGQDILVENSSGISDVKCGHCNKEYTIDKKTKWTSYILMALVVLVFSFLASLISQMFDISSFILLIPMVVLAFFLQKYILAIMARFNMVSYTPIS